MLIRNKQLTEIQLYSNGFIVNEDDSLIYNQIKGRNIFGYFTEEELTRINAIGNGESVYFGKDDNNNYIGVNKMLCSEIMIYLNNKKFHRITFKNTPTSEFHPMQKIIVTDFQLKDFQWKYNERPASKEDLITAPQVKEVENPSDSKSLQKEG